MIWKDETLKIHGHFDSKKVLGISLCTLLASATFWLTCLLSLSTGVVFIKFVTSLSHMIHMLQPMSGSVRYMIWFDGDISL